jgi:hypothetical protein
MAQKQKNQDITAAQMLAWVRLAEAQNTKAARRANSARWA